MKVDSNNDFVSVVIPTRNRAVLVKQAIESVLNQTHSNIQIIVVDDGSVDNTESALKEFIESGLIQYIRHESPLGASAARNTGIGVAQGKFIAGLDDDDMFMPRRIEELVRAYNPMYSFVHSNSYIIRNGKKILRKYPSNITFKKILYRNYVGNQIFVERQRIIEIGGFDTDLPARQDHDMWARLIKHFGQPLIVKKPLMVELQSHEGRISSVSENVRNGTILFFKKHGPKMDRTTKKFYAYHIERLSNNGFVARAFFANICFKVLSLELRHTGILVRSILENILIKFFVLCKICFKKG